MSNTVPPKPKSTKPPKEEWPTFILDLGEKPGDTWTIRYFEEYESQFWDDKIGGWKYSAISYAWGYWHDKRPTVKWNEPTTATKQTSYPAFDPKITTTWLFPVVNKNYKTPFIDFQDPIDPIFTPVDVKKTLTALGTRFVWWDWACVPQGPWQDLQAKKLPNPQPSPSPQTLLDIQTQEVDKMRIVYPYSLNGCLWLHETTWVRDTKSMKGPVQLLLEYIISIHSVTYRRLTVDAVEAFYGLLLAAQNSQASLVSVWSFQEGVLFGDSKRPSVLPDSKGGASSTCLILDHNGQAFGNHLDGLATGQGDYVQDIVATASIIFGMITDALALKATKRDINTQASPLEKWAYTEEVKARDLLSRLISTGFIGYSNNSPLSLFESKYVRTIKSTFNAEADRTVRAVVGAMDIDIDKASLKTAADEKAKHTSKPAADDAAKKANEAAGIQAELDVLKPAFLRTLIEAYRWRMLLHARGREVAAAPVPGAAPPSTKSWWTRFTDVKRPPFAALDYYIGSTKLYNVYKPRQQRSATLPADVYDLPDLEVAKTGDQPLIAKAKATYKFYDHTKATTKFWTECQFFDYIDSNPAGLPKELVDLRGLPHQPGTVAVRVIKGTDVAVREDTLGKNIILLPFEKNPESTGFAANSPAAPEIRCFVFSDYDAVKRKATFRGVGDFQGLNDADLVALDNDLELR